MIRPLRHDDLGAVVALYQRVVRGGGATPEWLEGYFRETLLEHPWYDEELPSLVSEEADGRIGGMIGVHARRLLFDGRPIRLACSGQLVADPAIGGAPGFFLVRAFLAGPQEISITDGANESARAIWTRLGGVVRELESISWMAALRPARAGLDVWTSRRPRGLLRSGGDAIGRASDSVWQRRSHGADRSAFTSTPLAPELLTALLPELGAGRRIAAAYDVGFSRWLLDTLGRSTQRGELRARVVEGNDSQRLGAFVYYRRRGGRSQVIGLLARPGHLRQVCESLFHDARRGGAAYLAGRLEPGVTEAMRGRRLFLRYSGEALVHARDEGLLRAVRAGEASLTLLDGEYWMNHHL